LSFVIRPNGKLLDGTSINKTISLIDTSVSEKPLCYIVNCVHPVIFRRAINNELNKTKLVRARLIGLLANGSSKSPEELILLSELDSDDPDSWAKEMINLHFDSNLKILEITHLYHSDFLHDFIPEDVVTLLKEICKIISPPESVQSKISNCISHIYSVEEGWGIGS